MSEEDSSRTYPPVYPSLAELSHTRDLINFASTNPMPTPMPRDNIPVHSQGSTNPTMQTNPPQYPAQNTSVSANAMPTSTPRGNIPVYCHLSSLSGPANPPMQTNPLQYPVPNQSASSNFMGNTPVLSHLDPLDPPSYQHKSVPIVAIGNPGAGKSTILNALAGQVLFVSGISLGSGLTKQLEAKDSNGQTFIDTPGVADDAYQKSAAEALTKVFHQGGHMKILFFITQESGRIVVQDVTTMKLILESVPEIGRNYGIIVNKIPKNVLSQLKEGETFLKLVLSLYSGIEDRFKNKNTLLIPLNNNLDNKNSVLLPPAEIHPDLENFITTTIPEIYITPGNITEIHLDDLEQLLKQVKELQSQLMNQERQKYETEKLLTQYENIEKDKLKEHEKTLKRNEQEHQQMKKIIREKEDEIRDRTQRSETEITGIKQRSEIEMRNLEQREKEINEHKDEINIKKIDFEQLGKQIKELESQLKNQEKQKSETEKLLAQLENMEKEKIKDNEKTLKRNEEELQKMKKNIKKKEVEIRDCTEKSETVIRRIQQRSEIEMRSLEQREHEINVNKDKLNKKKIAADQRKGMTNCGFKEWKLQDLFGTDFGLENAALNATMCNRSK